MISQELKLYEQPKEWSYTPVKSNVDYGMYNSQHTYSAEEIKQALKDCRANGIKVGQTYRHKHNPGNGFYITITGFEFTPAPSYYNKAPQVVVAKGSHDNAIECCYSLDEIQAMEKF